MRDGKYESKKKKRIDEGKEEREVRLIGNKTGGRIKGKNTKKSIKDSGMKGKGVWEGNVEGLKQSGK